MEGYWELGRSISVGSREEVARGSGECREVMLFLTVNFRENNAENRIDFAELFITWAKSLFTQKTYHVCGTPLTVKGSAIIGVITFLAWKQGTRGQLNGN